MFNTPLTDIASIEQRINTIKYFQAYPEFIEIDKEWLDFIEYYLAQGNKPTYFSVINILRKTIKNKIKQSNKNYLVQRGIMYLIDLLNYLYAYFGNLNTDSCPEQLLIWKKTVVDSFNNPNIRSLLELKNKKRLNPLEIGRLDYYFRYLETEKITSLLDIIYEVDVYKAVVLTSETHKLAFPTFVNDNNKVKIKGLFHPFLANAIPNDADLNGDQNICFLTGPNMAGKSTYMKSFGVAIYLSHIGFPVPAQSMETSVFNGLLTTINLADNLNMGYSHYYNEVLRVKYVAEQIGRLKNIVVIFDELFRGTNVKDAYEASLSVISALAKLKMRVFAISTHIIEVADQLKKNKAINFKFFEIKINSEIPEYTYSLKDGVTDERIGMYILKKENVIETIENAIDKANLPIQ